ncbi:DUF2917 domain-containing protein [Burkholderia vietnamiensis]|uniref:DUF2917 domain-containing protein n=1 Tax=Burkholderia vietnamiensis TaxID=60552 RepID=UPI00075E2F9C|nr:DUF2917 domain-containing protein [Burkholderia vietnamiensis]KVR88139.1 hypothetical protein WK28_26155 [Burkholderia vietnamiensis]KVS13037.1 hypothetical protein WK29_17430 [Burkholderia vietnamiensis]MBR8033124.1 DUF2917 domain-containing protein [Burkholderia vietnamiensis]MCA7988247.1 DUF2917 domain-containing protein [Burkholderia vietnamiensis]HDR8932111.1 DUF2917 domain-containing protein [Burkholderia vietnamiensis]
MDQASPLFDRPDSRRAGAIALPTVVIRFAVAPHTTLTWRAPSDAEIRAHGAALWITRPPSVDDYWVRPGDVLRIARGDRIWLGTYDGRPAEASITIAYVRRGDRLGRTVARVRGWLAARGRRRD